MLEMYLIDCSPANVNYAKTTVEIWWTYSKIHLFLIKYDSSQELILETFHCDGEINYAA